MLLLLLPCALGGPPPSLDREVRYVVPVHPDKEIPTLDGRISDGEWKRAHRIDGFGSGRRRVTGYVTATEDRFYFAIRSQLPETGEILAKVDSGSSQMIQDDAIEVWIDATPGSPSGGRVQLMTNYPGRQWSTIHLRGDGVEGMSQGDAKQWRADWEVANGKHEGDWHCEMAVDIASLPNAHAISEGTWHIDLWRNWKQPWTFSFMTDRRGIWQFADAATPVVRLIDDGVRFDGQIDYRLEVFNPTDAVIPVKASLVLERDVMPSMPRKLEATLEAGESKSIALTLQDMNTKAFTLAAAVEARQRTVFHHETDWKYTGPWTWETGGDKKPVDFQFAYYPSEERLRILADVTGLPENAGLQQLEATVRNAGNESSITTIAFNNLVDGKEEKWITLPQLQDGDYDIVLRATGRNVPDEPVVKSFKRYHFPWEGKDLGVTDTVYPPFKPMEVDGRTVRTVLREHQANGQGLWDQVTATNPNSGTTRPLLAEPMRYVVQVDGKSRELNGGPLKLHRVSDAEVRGQTRLETDGFAAEAKLTWEYDGMMRVDLTLLPSEKSIDELTLDIPLRAEDVTVYHAMGAGVRNTITDTVGPGKPGIVFTSRNIPSGGLPKDFCSYIYVGTPGRGLCWFAAGDRGWSRQSDTPNLRLVRRGKSIVLQVRFINRPIQVNDPRTITFGLLAAPVKPRLAQDKWRFAYQRQRYEQVGTGVNWGTISWASGHYPAGKDLLIWQNLRESTKRHLSEKEIQATLDHYAKYSRPYKSVSRFGKTWDKRYLEILRMNLEGARYNNRMIFYYNRAANTTQPEFLTYYDEWNLRDYREGLRTGGKYELNEHKIFPTDSYINYALYWYGKAFDIAGSEGVYWDNMFFRASYNTHTTDAYRTETDNVVPCTEVWGLRELTKRTFQYMNQRGMKPITMPHNTSTNILPVYSFATVNYDWEWHPQQAETLQDVMSPQYIALVTNGELAGTWPVVMRHPVPDTAEGLRTFVACAAVNDVYGAKERWRGPYGWALLRPIRHILDNPNHKVYRHWDEQRAIRPLGRSDWEVPTIAYVVPGERALVLIVNWTRDQQRMSFRLDPGLLGMNQYRVRDWESMIDETIDNDTFHLRLQPNDVWLLEILPE